MCHGTVEVYWEKRKADTMLTVSASSLQLSHWPRQVRWPSPRVSVWGHYQSHREECKIGAINAINLSQTGRQWFVWGERKHHYSVSAEKCGTFPSQKTMSVSVWVHGVYGRDDVWFFLPTPSQNRGRALEFLWNFSISSLGNCKMLIFKDTEVLLTYQPQNYSQHLTAT